VAQWIARLPPKEKVASSNFVWGVAFEHKKRGRIGDVPNIVSGYYNSTLGDRAVDKECAVTGEHGVRVDVLGYHASLAHWRSRVQFSGRILFFFFVCFYCLFECPADVEPASLATRTSCPILDSTLPADIWVRRMIC
jgi:hypothetical protein